MTELLFSYGTLQLDRVQLETFGRKLAGTKDSLSGYRQEKLEITDEKVLNSSNERFHPIAVQTNSPDDIIDGIVFELSETELEFTDTYEADDYMRIKVALASGKTAWAYVKNCG
jgi:hypothetical protein